ncbi:winged helix DNA-binding domain-containing protein [Streptomyces sp. P9(2023)]|uniref:winged helix DNA-binding domain-containing protein n=1 Tax=Streptomyces sp. P9(2023) TaxID=3064394 RepID=UPI0028F417F2|nr:winged helix DNA-binding domain-containing protein [Streptomyces sp. P9(2023)]MDT9691837.1 winged helix DNA-binding domain-containing protein [Streptomyces sp. P9(2023)]
MGNKAHRRIEDEERRARLGVRHRLAGVARAAGVEDVAESLVALHATDPATVFLAVGARLAGKHGVEGPVAGLERALYEDRTLTRMHGMRHTIFVFPTSLVPTVHASTTRDVATRERAMLIKDLAKGSAYDSAWLAETERLVLAELAVRGEATGAELGAAVPRLRTQYVYGVGTRQEGPQSLSSRLLRVLGMEGRIARGRPQGAWTSSRFRWAPTPEQPDPSDEFAHAELVRRWLAACGPATEADLKWWTGWKVTDVRKALSAIGAEAVELSEGTGYVLPDDLEPVRDYPEPWAALLPALDPTAMGWQYRDWYTDPAHKAALFDRSGNIGPTVWWNGRVVGGWAQRPDGEIALRFLSDEGGEAARAAAEAEAARLSGWVGDVRVTPRFRTPLERELAGG